MLLAHSAIYRCGKTVSRYAYETSNCSASVEPSQGAVKLQFYLSSKGGGDTDVLVKIGQDDLPSILKEIANLLPAIAPIFLECASIANQKRIEMLETRVKFQAREIESVKGIAEQLQPVEEFVSQIYRDMPSGMDDEAEKACDQIREAISSLEMIG